MYEQAQKAPDLMKGFVNTVLGLPFAEEAEAPEWQRLYERRETWRIGIVPEQGLFAAFGIDAVYTPAGSEPTSVRVIARRPDTIVGFGDTRLHAETAIFELRAAEVANPRPDDQLALDGETFLIQGEPERRDPDRLVWTLDVRIG